MGKYETIRTTEMQADGTLRSTDVVVVPIWVGWWVSIITGYRSIWLGVSRALLWSAEKLLEFAEWQFRHLVPAELLMNEDPDDTP